MGSFARLLLFVCAFFVGLILFRGEHGHGSRTPAPREQGDRTPPADRTAPYLPPPSSEDPVVEIESDGRQGSSVGSAFAMHPSGVWVTARHVVHGCTLTALRGRRDWVRARVHWLHPHADMAVLRTEGAPSHFALSTGAVHEGQNGFAFGFPQGRPGSVHGHLLGRTRMRSPGLYEGTAPTLAWAEVARVPRVAGTLGGISGGPLLDGQGNVLGVIVAEIPRRGRFESLAPEVLQEVAGDTALLPPDESDAQRYPVSPLDFGQVGDYLRARLSVAQVGCVVQ